jgi:hypothetical protein
MILHCRIHQPLMWSVSPLYVIIPPPIPYDGSPLLRRIAALTAPCLAPFHPLHVTSALYCDDVEKECLLAKFSLDLHLLALQRSPTTVEVRHDGRNPPNRRR